MKNLLIGFVFILFYMFFKNFIRKSLRGKLSEHFSWEEFDCKDGTLVPVQYQDNVRKLVEQLEIIRKEAGNQPIRINSGYRTVSHNQKIGGVTNSYHLKAMAADFTIKGLTPDEVHKLVLRLMNEGKIIKGGLGLYKTFVHYDIQGKVRLWTKI